MNNLTKNEIISNAVNYRAFEDAMNLPTDESMEGVEDIEFFFDDDTSDSGYASFTYY